MERLRSITEKIGQLFSYHCACSYNINIYLSAASQTQLCTEKKVKVSIFPMVHPRKRMNHEEHQKFWTSAAIASYLFALNRTDHPLKSFASTPCGARLHRRMLSMGSKNRLDGVIYAVHWIQA